MALEQELRTFEARLPELRAAHEGEFAFILGKDVLGVFPTYKEAIQAGKERVGFETPSLCGLDLATGPGPRSPSIICRRDGAGRSPRELKKKELEAMRAQIREKHGSVEAFVLKAMGWVPHPPTRRSGSTPLSSGRVRSAIMAPSCRSSSLPASRT